MTETRFFNPLFAYNQLAEYLIDAGQRTVLYWDVMRRRGNQYLKHMAETVPHVLQFEYEPILSGRSLPKPVNYGIVKIHPPEGIVIDDLSQFGVWDIDGVGGAEIQFYATTNDLSFSATDNQFQFLGTSYGLVSLSFSSVVSASKTFNVAYNTLIRSNSLYVAGAFSQEQPGYLGFRFDPDGNPNGVLYGWAEVVFDLDETNSDYPSFEILSWAYDDSGAPIAVGAIPEPASAALGLGALALGAAGLRRWRGSRKS